MFGEEKKKGGLERRCRKIGRDAAVRGFVVPGGRLVRMKGSRRDAEGGVLIQGRYREVEAAMVYMEAVKGREKGLNSGYLLVSRC